MLCHHVVLVTDSVFLQVPRAFVNMVEVIEIIGLRELYKETQVNCPRLILRSAGNFSCVSGRVVGFSRIPRAECGDCQGHPTLSSDREHLRIKKKENQYRLQQSP